MCNSPNRYLCVCFHTVQTDLPLWCFHASDAIQRESGRAATPSRWNKFNDQLKWEPTLLGLRHFNALSFRAWIKIVMTPCCLPLPIKHFAEPCSCWDYISGSIYDFCAPACSQQEYVFLTYPSAIKPKFVELTILYFFEFLSFHFFQTWDFYLSGLLNSQKKQSQIGEICIFLWRWGLPAVSHMANTSRSFS